MSESLFPLAGTRVLDLTISWAGPWCTKILGDLGADVIKVEAVQAYDLTRGPVTREDWRAYARRGSDAPPYERTDTFLKPNRNKRGITLNLKDPRGRALCERLAAIADIVAENYAPGEMEKFGLGFEHLRRRNPGLVMLRMPAIGASGPERDYVGYGTTLEMLSGITALTGYEDGTPVKSSFWYGDPIVGVHAAGAVLLALLERDRTGSGQIVELSQLEMLIGFAADGLMQYEVNGRTYETMGNRDLVHEPQSCYESAEPDRWVALSICTPAQWTALATLLGQQRWLNEAGFSTPDERRAHRVEIDACIARWVAGRSQSEAADALVAAGVPAAPVLTSRQIFEDPHVRAREFFEEVEHPLAGTHLYPGAAWLLDGARPPTRRPAPLLGQHNTQVLEELLGLSRADIEALQAANVIGNEPLVDVWAG